MYNNYSYYINTSEIPSELCCENFIPSHVKITCYLHTWRDHRRYGYIINPTFESKLIWYFTGVYMINRILHKQNINLMSELHSLVRYRVDHSKINFISMRGHVISSIYFRFLFICRPIGDNFFYHNIIKVAVEITRNKISLVKKLTVWQLKLIFA